MDFQLVDGGTYVSRDGTTYTVEDRRVTNPEDPNWDRDYPFVRAGQGAKWTWAANGRYDLTEPLSERDLVQQEKVKPVENEVNLRAELVDVIDDALLGHRGPDQRRIAEVGVQWILTMLAKNHDYGSSVWEPPMLAGNVDSGTGILCRMSDKVSRLQTLMKGATAEVKESIEDTLSDLGAYCLLYLAKPDDR